MSAALLEAVACFSFRVDLVVRFKDDMPNPITMQIRAITNSSSSIRPRHKRYAQGLLKESGLHKIRSGAMELENFFVGWPVRGGNGLTGEEMWFELVT